MDTKIAVVEQNGRKVHKYYDGLIKVKSEGRTFITDNEYFAIDPRSDFFKEKMERTGGFCAEATVRFCKEKGIDPKKILFVAMPSEYVKYSMRICFTGENDELLDYLSTNCPLDYQYFRNAFDGCVIEQGESSSIIPSLFEGTNVPEAKSEAFPLEIEGRLVTAEDTLEIREDGAFPIQEGPVNFGIFKDEYRDKLRALGAVKLKLSMELGYFDGFFYQAVALKEDGEPVSEREFYYGTNDKDAVKKLVMKQFEEKYGIPEDEEELEEELKSREAEANEVANNEDVKSFVIPMSNVAEYAKQNGIFLANETEMEKEAER